MIVVEVVGKLGGMGKRKYFPLLLSLLLVNGSLRTCISSSAGASLNERKRARWRGKRREWYKLPALDAFQHASCPPSVPLFSPSHSVRTTDSPLLVGTPWSASNCWASTACLGESFLQCQKVHPTIIMLVLAAEPDKRIGQLVCCRASLTVELCTALPGAPASRSKAS